MALGFLKRLFGGSEAPTGPAAPDLTKAVMYKDCRILPTPRAQGGQYLTSARIERDRPDGSVQVHELVRADTHGSAGDAETFAVQKAKQVIDEQGERLFT